MIKYVETFYCPTWHVTPSAMKSNIFKSIKIALGNKEHIIEYWSLGFVEALQ